MKDKIPQFLQDKLKLKTTNTKTFPKEIKDFMVEYAKFYSWNISNDILKIYKLMQQSITDLPQCAYVGCTNKVYINARHEVTLGCCQKHSAAASNLSKYGVENVFELKDIKEKKRKTMLIKYGVEQSAQSITIRKKQENTMIERYGVRNASKVYLFKQKKENTMIERYGVRNATHNPELLEKLMKNSFRYKEYIWKTGEVSLVQGYEPIILSELETKGYKFHDVITSFEEMPEIYYTFGGSKRRYFPDIFIPKENMIIEVKSKWTLDLDYDKNKAKFEATTSLGFDFRLEIR